MLLLLCRRRRRHYQHHRHRCRRHHLRHYHGHRGRHHLSRNHRHRYHHDHHHHRHPHPPDPDDSFLCSLQEELVLKNLKVRVVNQGELTISFCGSEERDEGNMLCEVDVTLPPSANDLDVSVGKMFIIHAASFIV